MQEASAGGDREEATVGEELEAVRAALAAAQVERAAMVTEVEARAVETAAQLEGLQRQAAEAEARALAAQRRAILAEHAGQVVPELVQGTTVEELETSVEGARAAYTRAVEAARQQLGGTQVPVGAATRGEPSVESLSALDKITQALRKF
jgi:hypothetical protein